MDRVRRGLREPLVHFLALGGLLFGAWSLVAEPDALAGDSRTITVDRAALMTFLQYRAAAFEPAYFEAQFDALSDEQLAQLARDYVREEAMEREARALSLDRGDYVIRRRLVQKIEYLVADADLNPQPPGEQELRAYFDSHKDEFRVAEEFTFTHVFADAEKDHPGGSEAQAGRLLAQLKARGAGFNDAPLYGDRFPYQRNYVGQTARFIASELGPEFVAALAALQPGESWQGPIASSFGHHLLLLSGRRKPQDARFEDVREQVLAGVLQQRRARSREALLDELVDQYDVRFEGLSRAGKAWAAGKAS